MAEFITTQLYPISSSDSLFSAAGEGGVITPSISISSILTVVRISVEDDAITEVYDDFGIIGHENCVHATYGYVYGINESRLLKEYCFTVALQNSVSTTFLDENDAILEGLSVTIPVGFGHGVQRITVSQEGKSIPVYTLKTAKTCSICGGSGPFFILTDSVKSTQVISAAVDDGEVASATIYTKTFESKIVNGNLVLTAHGSGEFTPSEYGITTSTPALALLIGGGGGGGYYGSGGGGGGGFLETAIYIDIETTESQVIIGLGGCAAVGSGVTGGNGGNTEFLGFIAYGGGGGGSGSSAAKIGADGASGGGGAGTGTLNAGGRPLELDPMQGYAGGYGFPSSTCWSGGGGGGAGQVGGNALDSTLGGHGGNGAVSSITGVATYYGGGGGGRGGCGEGVGGNGGLGGGGSGAGGHITNNDQAEAGTDGLGGGGGAGTDYPINGYPPKRGGRGVIIIRVAGIL